MAHHLRITRTGQGALYLLVLAYAGCATGDPRALVVRSHDPFRGTDVLSYTAGTYRTFGEPRWLPIHAPGHWNNQAQISFEHCAGCSEVVVTFEDSDTLSTGLSYARCPLD